MSFLALWYRYSPEGQRFLQGRELRITLTAAGILAAYLLVRTRQRIPHRESWWRRIGRSVVAGSVAAALWFAVDWVRGEDWIIQLLAALPELHENGIRYSALIAAGWLGWSIAFFEGLRRIFVNRNRKFDQPPNPR